MPAKDIKGMRGQVAPKAYKSQAQEERSPIGSPSTLTGQPIHVTHTLKKKGQYNQKGYMG